MTDRSDHLIERAAALLRSANASQVAETSSAGASRPADGGAARQESTGSTAHTPPAFIQPPRPILPTQHRQPEPSGRVAGGSMLARGGSAAEIRSSSGHPPVTLAMMEQAGLMVARTNRTRTTEEYRIVIGRVLRALHEEADPDFPLGMDASQNVVLVTSARPGEGKSFTALNLGGSIAQNAGESVLIVDVDAKNNSLTDQLGLNDRLGFLDMVARPELPVDDLIVSSELPNLSLLPLGSRSMAREQAVADPSAPEERRLTPPIQRLARRFPRTLILLDAPPCLSTSDPHTLAPSVGQVVMVVEAERTQRNEVEAAIDLIRICPTITMLLNKVRMSSGHTFGSYDYFGSYT